MKANLVEEETGKQHKEKDNEDHGMAFGLTRYPPMPLTLYPLKTILLEYRKRRRKERKKDEAQDE